MEYHRGGAASSDLQGGGDALDPTSSSSGYADFVLSNSSSSASFEESTAETALRSYGPRRFPLVVKPRLRLRLTRHVGVPSRATAAASSERRGWRGRIDGGEVQAPTRSSSTTKAQEQQRRERDLAQRHGRTGRCIHFAARYAFSCA